MSTEIPEPVATIIEVVNRHDSDAFLDAFAPDGHVDDWGRVFTGRRAIEEWSDREFIGSDGVLTPQQVTSEAGRVTVVGDWASTHANGLSAFTFVLDEDDRLAAMVIREG